MPPAARVTDQHTCPKPYHVGGPIVAGASTVLIGFMPAARVGDPIKCAVGEDKIVKGCPSVLITHAPAARQGDATEHGGAIVGGLASVLIGD